jgi:ssRNA-specific RNase YbeY (16S rRNA maturation enzyme)
VFSFSPSYDYLLYFLLIHGLLHLAGYNDEIEKERLAIIALGEKIMKLLQKNDIIKTTV